MMLIATQILLGILFLAVSFISFVIPFYPLVKKLDKNLDDLEKLTISAVLGIVLFTLFAYIFAWLHIRFLMFAFPIAGFISLYRERKELLRFKLEVNKKLFLPILILGILGMVLVNAPSGFPYKDGVYFWSSHGHDGVWHLALMNELHKDVFPFQNPELAGNRLQNYHFFSDLLMSEFSRLFPFSNLDIYFRFMPTIFAILLGLSGFIFVRLWSRKEIAGIWAMIFTYCAGSFGYLLYIPTHKSLGGESIFWVSQTQSVLGNPPHASAFIIMTTFLFALLKYLNSRKLFYFFLCVLLGGTVIEFKVYAGVLILGGLLALGIYELLFKRIYQTLSLFLTTLSVALVIYLPNSANSQDFLIWQPWWYIRTMVVAPDRLNWLDLELRRQTYIAEYNWKRVIQLEITAFLIFLFGNLGMRFIGFWTIFKQLKMNIFKNSFNLFFLTITTASFFIPVFFLQKGVAWNSIQFNQYFLLLFGFLASITTAEILSKIKSLKGKIIISSLLIILMIPTQIGLLWNFYKDRPLAKVTYEEINALKFLRDNSNENTKILTATFDGYEQAKYYPPVPIYAWYETGYLPAFSGRRTLITDTEQVKIMGYKVDELLKDREKAFTDKSETVFIKFLAKYPVDYLYLVWGQKIQAPIEKLPLKLIYQGQHTKIYQVVK